MPLPFSKDSKNVTPLYCLTQKTAPAYLKTCTKAQKSWLKACDFEKHDTKLTLVPGNTGTLDHAVFYQKKDDCFWSYAPLAKQLPAGLYKLASTHSEKQTHFICLAWALATYQFKRYKKSTSPSSGAKLIWPESIDREAVLQAVEGTTLVRDLINMPANKLTPAQLATESEALARPFKAKLHLTKGDDLLIKNFPAIHAVGRASAEPPHLIDLQWQPKSASQPLKKVTLVGKGVCFDTGGLNLKPDKGMILMKKDMGGGAHVLGLAKMIMMANLPIQLRVLIPAVENSVSNNAMRPSDIIQTRKGLTVEIGHTDAEGRLVLADALTLACEDKPDLIIDCATLTGSARIALGTDLPALFCNHEATATGLLKAAEIAQDPLWRLPLYQPYDRLLDGAVSDLNNIGKSSYGSAITAALFLQRFVEKGTPWIHIDMMAYNLSSRPGRPEGGEAMGLRALFKFLKLSS